MDFSSPREDTDLRDLDFDSAREYMLAFAVDAKRLDKEISDARAELELWEGRAALAGKRLLAGESAMADLEAAAKAKADEARQKIATLDGERTELRSKVEIMRQKLPGIKAKERSVDPDRLLAELQMMTGELLGPGDAAFAGLDAEAAAGGAEKAASGAPLAGGDGAAAPTPAPPGRATVEREINKLEASTKAESALEELKRKMAGGQG